MAEKSTYSYRARDASGQLISGTLVASTADEVASVLRSEGRYVVAIGEQALKQTAELDSGQVLLNEAAKRVKRSDVVAFAQQIAIMLDAGVSLSEALETFQKQVRNREFRTVLTSLCEDVYAGEQLSKAMSKWPRVFPTLMVSLMKASEASGTMSEMLARVGDYLGKEQKTVRQIKGALSYPIFMLLLGLGITMFLMAVVLPRFARIYEQRSATLPTPTKILIGASEFVMQDYMYYGPAIAGLFFVVLIWRTFPSYRKCVDWLKLKTPVLRGLFGQLYLTRATRTMATLLGSGVGLLDAISISRGVTNNHFWEELWDDVEERVRDGGRLADAFSDSWLIPPNVASMIAAGDRSGRTSQVMDRIAHFSEEELDAAVKQATAFIEPLMICVMGVVVGGVALALLMPIFTIGNVMGGG